MRLFLIVAAVGALFLPLAALSEGPPTEAGPFRKSELVELKKIIPGLRLDIRYATSHNFMKRPVYRQARAFLQKPAASALARVQNRLRVYGYGLVILDGYRPWSVTKLFWDLTPESQRDYVANPKRGSRHNRGCAVDVTLCNLKRGKEVAMPSGYDEPTRRAHADFAGGAPAARRRRDLLRRCMEAEGFKVYSAEWWHFDYKDWQSYPLLDVPFEKL